MTLDGSQESVVVERLFSIRTFPREDQFDVLRFQLRRGKLFPSQDAHLVAMFYVQAVVPMRDVPFFPGRIFTEDLSIWGASRSSPRMRGIEAPPDPARFPEATTGWSLCQSCSVRTNLSPSTARKR